MSDFPPTPPEISSSIKDFLAGGHGISSPRQYQVDTIFHIAFRKPTFTYLIRQPGEGKSLCLYGAASLLKGIIVCLVPLIGLGSDQVAKTERAAIGLEAYHADEMRDDKR